MTKAKRSPRPGTGGSDGSRGGSNDSERTRRTTRGLSPELPLTSSHSEQLAASGITDAVAEHRGYRSIDAPSELEPYGFSEDQCRPGLLIPFWWNGKRVQHQLRPDKPRKNKKGDTLKYESPGCKQLRLDCHPLMQPALDDPSQRLFVTEGVKKVDALASASEVAIGLAGVWGWSRNKKPHPDLDDVEWAGRDVYIVYDSDVMTNPKVQEAAQALTEELRGRGAEVRWVYLPDDADGSKVGVDDYLAAGHDVDDLLALATEPPGAFPDDWPVPVGYRAPRSWIVDESGVSRLTKDGVPVPVAPSPLVIVGRLVDEEDGREATELAWMRDGEWRRGTFDRGDVLDRAKLLRLAGVGVPVHSGNAADLARYLSDLEAENMAVLSPERMTAQLGWIGERFVVGTGGEVVFNGASGLDEVAAAYSTAGTMDAWRDAVSALTEHPRVALGIYAALAPPLLRVIGGDPFVIDWSGQTSTGKTTTLRVAASVWGSQDLLRSWDATGVGIEMLAGMLNGLPLLLDETRRVARRRHEDIGQVIYDVSQGHGRVRGARSGGIQKTRRWSTVVLSTGEQPITTFGGEGGTRARVVSLHGSPFEAEDRALVTDLTSAVADNYGHAGRAFVDELLARRGQWKRWATHFEKVASDLASVGETPIEQRRARYIAVLRMAAGLAERFDVFGPLPADEWWRGLVVSGAGREDDDRPKAALEVAWSWAVGHPHHFWSKEHSYAMEPNIGWAGRWDRPDADIMFRGEVLKSFLEKQDHDYLPTLAAWGERGWVRQDRKGGNSVTQKLGDSAVRLVVVRYSAVREVLLDGDEEERDVLASIEDRRKRKETA